MLIEFRKKAIYLLLLICLPMLLGFATADTVPTLDDIKALIAQGQWQQAENSAQVYIQHYPKDVDGSLELAIIKNHEKDYAAVEQILQPALAQYPRYLDIRLLLINAEITLNNNQKALALVEDGLVLEPQNTVLLKKKADIQSINTNKVASAKKVPSVVTKASSKAPSKAVSTGPTLADIKALTAQDQWQQAESSAKIYVQHYPHDVDGFLALARIKNHEKDHVAVEQILEPVLAQYPRDLDIRVLLIHAEIALKQWQKALVLVNEGLALEPQNEVLLKKKAYIEFENGDTVASVKTLQQVLTINPQDEKAQNLLTEVRNTPPQYGVGPYKVGAYSWGANVSNVNQEASTNQKWYYDSLYLGADTTYGYLQARGNYANRLGLSGTQAELQFDPKINRYLYFELVTAYSDQEALFPHYLVGAEAYANIPHVVDFSLGEKYRNLGATYINTYTASLSKPIKEYWFSFRPYYFVPSNGGPRSTLYTLKARRHFGSPDFYLELSGGTGHSPDLPDLTVAALIKVQNNYVHAKLNFPIDNHRYVVSIGPMYERLVYPSGTVLTLYSGGLNLSMRFS